MADYIYKTTIKETYGLPESWIALLGEPDKVVPNPHRRSQKSKLYLRARVEALIESRRAEYEKLLERRAARSQIAQRVMAERSQALVAWAETVEIRVAPLPEKKQTLEAAARIEFENFRINERGDFWAELIMSRNALIAHVRHNYTNYHRLLSQMEGKPGIGMAYQIVRERINTAVEQRFRALYGEGWDQFE
ncbi:MAG: DUF2293 domain-containing protein [Ardenticatenales bacterium]|nr:DUF2293 domain-containing protein [Ardenticatenales bacterium]